MSRKKVFNLLEIHPKKSSKVLQITLFENSNFCPKIQFWQKTQHFHKFFTQIFLTIFLVKSKLSTAKKSKTTTFSRVFHPKKSTIFSENQSWIFGQKIKISNSVKRNCPKGNCPKLRQFLESSNTLRKPKSVKIKSP